MTNNTHTATARLFVGVHVSTPSGDGVVASLGTRSGWGTRDGDGFVTVGFGLPVTEAHEGDEARRIGRKSTTYSYERVETFAPEEVTVKPAARTDRSDEELAAWMRAHSTPRYRAPRLKFQSPGWTKPRRLKDDELAALMAEQGWTGAFE